MSCCPRYDDDRRTVVCYDTLRCVGRVRADRLRLAFYVWSVACSSSALAGGGDCRVLLLNTHRDDEQELDSLLLDSIQFCLDALPGRISSITCAAPPNIQLVSKCFSSVVPDLKSELVGVLTHRCCCKRHLRLHEEDLLIKFEEEYGIGRSALPAILGGNWTLEQFKQWQEHRVRYELDLPRLRGIDATKIPHIPSYTIKAHSKLTKEEKIGKCRRSNVLRSRRKQTREELDTATMQVAEPQEQNRALREENTRLEGLLSYARAKVYRLFGDERRCQQQEATEGSGLPPFLLDHELQ